MVELLAAASMLALGFVVGYWLALGEIHHLREQLHYMEGKEMARELDSVIDDLEHGKGDWGWPGSNL